MSIDRSVFETGESEGAADEMILRFLREHPHRAYTSAEICEGLLRSVTPPGWDSVPRETRFALFDLYLDGLVRNGHVESRRVRSPIGWGRHYACRRATTRTCKTPGP
jgi:hypothetical protein